MNNPAVYILFSHKDKKTYTGSTIDLAHRLKEHSMGLVKSTRNRRPLTLIYHELFENIEDTRAREHFYKTSWGRCKLKKILQPILEKMN